MTQEQANLLGVAVSSIGAAGGIVGLMGPIKWLRNVCRVCIAANLWLLVMHAVALLGGGR